MRIRIRGPLFPPISETRARRRRRESLSRARRTSRLFARVRVARSSSALARARVPLRSPRAVDPRARRPVLASDRRPFRRVVSESATTPPRRAALGRRPRCRCSARPCRTRADRAVAAFLASSPRRSPGSTRTVRPRRTPPRPPVPRPEVPLDASVPARATESRASRPNPPPPRFRPPLDPDRLPPLTFRPPRSRRHAHGGPVPRARRSRQDGGVSRAIRPRRLRPALRRHGPSRRGERAQALLRDPPRATPHPPPLRLRPRRRDHPRRGRRRGRRSSPPRTVRRASCRFPVDRPAPSSPFERSSNASTRRRDVPFA